MMRDNIMRKHLLTLSLSLLLLLSLILPALAQSGYIYKFFPGGSLVKYSWPGFRSFGYYSGSSGTASQVSSYWQPSYGNQPGYLRIVLVAKSGENLIADLSSEAAQALAEGIEFSTTYPSTP